MPAKTYVKTCQVAQVGNHFEKEGNLTSRGGERLRNYHRKRRRVRQEVATGSRLEKITNSGANLMYSQSFTELMTLLTQNNLYEYVP